MSKLFVTKIGMTWAIVRRNGDKLISEGIGFPTRIEAERALREMTS